MADRQRRLTTPQVGAWALFAVAYYVAVWVGLRMAVFPETVSPVWPATGVAIAGLTRLGRSAWPIVLVVAFLAEIPGLGIVGGGLAAIGNTLEAWIGAWILVRAGGDRVFLSSRGVGRFLLAVATAPIPSVIFGTLGVATLGGGTALVEVATTWYLGNALGALLLTPALVLAHPRQVPDAPPLEASAFVAVYILAAIAAFYPWRPASLADIRLGFIVIVPLVWAATRFGPLGSAWATVGIAGAAHWGLQVGTVPLFGTPNVILLQLQGLIGLIGGLTLFLAANVAHRNESIRLLMENERHLEAAVERLRNASQQKAAFLQKASHEMRTPLTPIRMQIHLLKSDPTVMEDHRRSIEMIDSSTKRLARLVDAMLEASRAQSTTTTELHVMPARRLLEEVRSMHVQAAAARDIMITTQAPDVEVAFDRGAVHHILDILLGNAIRHSPDGGQIAIMGHVEGRMFAICVQDDGPGIPPEDRDQIFEPFADSIQIRTDTGPGLDLFIAHTIADGIGGRLGLKESEDGACFELKLRDAVR